MNTIFERQSLFPFEQAVEDAKLAVEIAKLQAKLTAKAKRLQEKRQAELDKIGRRVMRVHRQKQKEADEYAQCGINWYSRSPATRGSATHMKHCHVCGQLLIYSSDKHAKPQECAGRKRF